MNRALLTIALCVLALPAWATDGDSVLTTIPATGKRGTEEPICMKICDAASHTTATDCGPMRVPNRNAAHVTIKVTSANNAGAACAFDDWGVFENSSNVTPSVTNTFGAICAIDDDGSSTVSAQAGGECKIFGPTLPWIFIKAGTLPACASGIEITGCWFSLPNPH